MPGSTNIARRLFRSLVPAGAVVMIAGLAAPLTSVPQAVASDNDEATGPDSIRLTGIVRDFRTEHPDMETYPDMFYRDWNGANGVYEGLVADTLDADGKPVFNEDLLEDRTWEDIPLTSRESLAQWFRDIPGINLSIAHEITLERQGDLYVFAKERPEYFFPIDNAGFGNSQGWLRWAQPGSRNFHFTVELETEFTYIDPEDRDYDLVFSFTGDDDVWVFINGKLAVDIGGVHSQASRSVNLDSKAQELGLEPGESYQLKLFFAERHSSESNFRIETTLVLRTAELPNSAHLFD